MFNSKLLNYQRVPTFEDAPFSFHITLWDLLMRWASLGSGGPRLVCFLLCIDLERNQGTTAQAD